MHIFNLTSYLYVSYIDTYAEYYDYNFLLYIFVIIWILPMSVINLLTLLSFGLFFLWLVVFENFFIGSIFNIVTSK